VAAGDAPVDRLDNELAAVSRNHARENRQLIR
jgi:hypothetical protein